MTQSAQVLNLAKSAQFLQAHDLANRGIPAVVLRRMAAQGQLIRVGRGLYTPAHAEPTEYHSLAEASLQVPTGVICLLTALRYHHLTTQAPFEVWMALDVRAWKPRVEGGGIRVVRFSGASRTEGIETNTIEGVAVRIYNPAKTVADCFKFRGKIGLDVAIEALRESVRTRRATFAELEHFAEVCRVSNVMHPYLAMLAT